MAAYNCRVSGLRVGEADSGVSGRFSGLECLDLFCVGIAGSDGLLSVSGKSLFVGGGISWFTDTELVEMLVLSVGVFVRGFDRFAGG